MSCNRCAKQAAGALAAVGVPPSQSMGVYGKKAGGQTWQYLPRCPGCKKWVSPRHGICHYAKCKRKGTQVVQATGWPPPGALSLPTKAAAQAGGEVAPNAGLSATQTARRAENQRGRLPAGEEISPAEAEGEMGPGPQRATLDDKELEKLNTFLQDRLRTLREMRDNVRADLAFWHSRAQAEYAAAAKEQLFRIESRLSDVEAKITAIDGPPHLDEDDEPRPDELGPPADVTNPVPSLPPAWKALISPSLSKFAQYCQARLKKPGFWGLKIKGN